MERGRNGKLAVVQVELPTLRKPLQAAASLISQTVELVLVSSHVTRQLAELLPHPAAVTWHLAPVITALHLYSLRAAR